MEKNSEQNLRRLYDIVNKQNSEEIERIKSRESREQTTSLEKAREEVYCAICESNRTSSACSDYGNHIARGECPRYDEDFQLR